MRRAERAALFRIGDPVISSALSSAKQNKRFVKHLLMEERHPRLVAALRTSTQDVVVNAK